MLYGGYKFTAAAVANTQR